MMLPMHASLAIFFGTSTGVQLMVQLVAVPLIATNAIVILVKLLFG